MIGMRIGKAIGLGAADSAALFYGLLLKDLGCSSNASKVYIEVYPKAPNSTDWISVPGYTGPATGSTNLTTYARTFRRAIPINGAVGNVSLVLPRVCGVAGGTTGSLVGHISGFGAGSVTAWWMAPDGTHARSRTGAGTGCSARARTGR